jgi:hypothetical protein
MQDEVAMKNFGAVEIFRHRAIHAPYLNTLEPIGSQSWLEL